MSKPSKRQSMSQAKIDPMQQYVIADALALVKECANAKFDETIDVAIRIGVDPRKSDQMVRGSTVLPHGTGRKVKVAVFAQGEQADAAKEAGADRVGFDDLAEAIKKGDLDFDVLIATPDSMRVVGQLGQILGPRGLMPNPKVGTVAKDVATAVNNAKSGQVRYRIDKAAILHSPIGRASFDGKKLHENLEALIADLVKLKPSSAKGTYIRKVSISSTMGPGVVVDLTSLKY